MTQATVSTTLRFKGTGLHSGEDVELAIRPAGPNHGIVFRQLKGDFADSRIPANFRHVAGTRRCTSLANRAGASVRTVEHLMAALAGCGITNAIVDVTGPEVPAMDGSVSFLACSAGRGNSRRGRRTAGGRPRQRCSP